VGIALRIDAPDSGESPPAIHVSPAQNLGEIVVDGDGGREGKLWDIYIKIEREEREERIIERKGDT
jgi:hypothetical protein